MLQVDGFSSDTSVEFEDLMSSNNLDEMKAEVRRILFFFFFFFLRSGSLFFFP